MGVVIPSAAAAAAALTLMLAAATAGPASTASGDATFEAGLLDAHNRERASLGLRPFRWSDALAAGARSWAEHLAGLGKLEHSRPGQRGRAGENLWLGTAGHYGPDEMVGDWIAEKTDFVPRAIFPDAVAKPGKSWGEVGHYTQLVWRHTTHLGCGLASSGAWDVLVCRYSPAGNIVGQVPY